MIDGNAADDLYSISLYQSLFSEMKADAMCENCQRAASSLKFYCCFLYLLVIRFYKTDTSFLNMEHPSNEW